MYVPLKGGCHSEALQTILEEFIMPDVRLNQNTAAGYRQAQIRGVGAAIRRTQQAMGETDNPAAQARLGALLGRQQATLARVEGSMGGIGAGCRGVRVRSMANTARRRAGVDGTSRTAGAARNYVAARRRTAGAVGAANVGALNRLEGIAQGNARGRR